MCVQPPLNAQPADIPDTAKQTTPCYLAHSVKELEAENVRLRLRNAQLEQGAHDCKVTAACIESKNTKPAQNYDRLLLFAGAAQTLLAGPDDHPRQEPANAWLVLCSFSSCRGKGARGVRLEGSDRSRRYLLCGKKMVHDSLRCSDSFPACTPTHGCMFACDLFVLSRKAVIETTSDRADRQPVNSIHAQQPAALHPTHCHSLLAADIASSTRSDTMGCTKQARTIPSPPTATSNATSTIPQAVLTETTSSDQLRHDRQIDGGGAGDQWTHGPMH